jgi:hypothetical protein
LADALSRGYGRKEREIEEIERESHVIYSFALSIIPRPLQTAEYARRAFRTWNPEVVVIAGYWCKRVVEGAIRLAGPLPSRRIGWPRPGRAPTGAVSGFPEQLRLLVSERPRKPVRGDSSFVLRLDR